tara:strand:- start:7120 stop:8313 length:1194 start_codon:yes stop_codon:yes gene_type:complete
MKKLIFKNLLKDITNFFLISIVSISVIVWVIQAVNYLDFVSEDGHSFRIYFLYTLLSLPKIIGRVLPFMFFLSLFYILIKYEENNELVIFWLNGIKKISFINIIIKFSIIFLIIQLFFSSFLIPKTQDLARSFIRSSNIDSFSALIKERKFIDTVSDLTIYVDKKFDNGLLQNIFLKDEITKDKSQFIYAKEGKLVDVNKVKFLFLKDGKIINKDKKGTSIFNFETSQFNLSKFTTKTTTYPKIQEIRSSLLVKCIITYETVKRNFNSGQELVGVNKSDIEKIFAEKYGERFLVCRDSSIAAIKSETFRRFFLPMYLPVIALLVSTLVLFSKDKFDYSRFKGKIFVSVVVLIILSEISSRYIGKEFFMNLVFAFSPIFLFSVIYFFINKEIRKFDTK